MLCYKFSNRKNNNTKIINYVDIGEDDLISINVDISDMLLKKDTEYLINIISQEIRFEKKLNFYEPKKFKFSSNSQEIPETPKIPKLLIILVSVFGFIIILIIILLLIRCCLKKRGKNNNEIIETTKTIPNEQLLGDI